MSSNAGRLEQIQLSHHRSRLAGLSPGDLLDLTPVDWDPASRLLDAARPVLDQLGRSLDGIVAGGLLADRDATVVDHYFGDRSVRDDVERLGAGRGVSLLEERSGTNAIATAHETRAPVLVLPEEHYLDALKHFSCFGAPIFHPVTGRLEGVVDLMVRAGTEPGLMEGLVNRAVEDISTRLVERSDPSLALALAAFRRLSSRVDCGVTLLGTDFVVHNRRSADLVTPGDAKVLGALVRDLPLGRSTDVVLASGAAVTVTTSSCPTGSVLLRIDDGERARPPVPRSFRRDRSPAEQVLHDLARRTGHVLIEGEPGSGRSRAAAIVGGADSTTHVMSATGPSADLDRVVAAAGRGSVVVEDVHLAGSAARAALARHLRDGDARLVLTATRSADAADVDPYVRSLCTHWIETPPLRERAAELPEIAAEILGRLAGHEDDEQPALRLGRSAVTVLAGHTWPGNIAELTALLTAVADGRPRGVIMATDLPDRYRRATGLKTGLTPLESRERDLIVRALSMHHDNKVRSAQHLGISRSTLYSRLRYFKLT